MDFFVAYLDQHSQAGMCRPHRAASQTSAALPACCILNKRGLGHVVFVLLTFRGWQVYMYVEPQFGKFVTVGAQSIACAQSIAPSLIGDNICEKNLNF
jgi:hypothetical protein